MGAPIPIDVAHDSNSDRMIRHDYHAERSVDSSAVGGGADGAPPAVVAADLFDSFAVDINAGCDRYEAETTCWSTGSGGANSNGMIGDKELLSPRVIGDDFHAERSVNTSAMGGGGADGADGDDDVSVSVDDREFVQLRAVLETRVAELAQLKAVDHELMRLRAILEVREAELAQLNGLDHSKEEMF